MTNLQQVAHVCRAIWPGARPTALIEHDAIVVLLGHRNLVHRLIILHEPAPSGIRLVKVLFRAGIPGRIDSATEGELVIVDMTRDEDGGCSQPSACAFLH